METHENSDVDDELKGHLRKVIPPNDRRLAATWRLIYRSWTIDEIGGMRAGENNKTSLEGLLYH